MNASPHLLHAVERATVRVQAEVAPNHPSTAVLGSERVGTGVVLRPDHLILTVQYVVLGARACSITFTDETVVPGRVVAHDFASGIALIEPATRPRHALPVRPSRELVRGADVFAVAFGSDGERRVSDGVITHLDPFEANWEMALERAITTTARNPGLGGAPLADAGGNCIGVSFLDLGEVGSAVLAIPADVYLEHGDELLRHGRRVTRPARAWIGIFCYEFREHVIVAGVLPGSPAARAGLRGGDLIVTVDAVPVAGRRQLYELLWAASPGASFAMRIFRDGEILPLDVGSTDVDGFFA